MIRTYPVLEIAGTFSHFFEFVVAVDHAGYNALWEELRTKTFFSAVLDKSEV